MGKLLISGNGKDFVKSTATNWIIIVIIAIAFIVLGVILANQFGYQTLGGTAGRVAGGVFGVTPPQVRTVAYYIFMWGGIILAAIIVVHGLLQDIFATKTEIFVYENGIKGIGGGPKFAQSLEDTTTVASFELEYDRIASVDITHKKLLSINAYGRVYVIAVANANEIIDVINDRLRQVKSSKATVSTESVT